MLSALRPLCQHLPMVCHSAWHHNIFCITYNPDKASRPMSTGLHLAMQPSNQTFQPWQLARLDCVRCLIGAASHAFWGDDIASPKGGINNQERRVPMAGSGSPSNEHVSGLDRSGVTAYIFPSTCGTRWATGLCQGLVCAWEYVIKCSAICAQGHQRESGRCKSVQATAVLPCSCFSDW